MENVKVVANIMGSVVEIFQVNIVYVINVGDISIIPHIRVQNTTITNECMEERKIESEMH
jgi:hypothetical protein